MGEKPLNQGAFVRRQRTQHLRKGFLELLTEEEWRRVAVRSPGRVPADGPDGGEGAPRPLDLHLLLAVLVADADNPVEHPQSQVLPVVCPAVQTTARGRGEGKGNTAGKRCEGGALLQTA